MKSSKIFKIIWVSGIYLILLVLLYLIIEYKVKWEHKDLNTYLYLYDCGDDLCSSTTIQEEYYSKILCEDNICPYIIQIVDDNLILKRNDRLWLYNYKTDKITNDKYVYYRYIDNNMFVVGDNTGNYGIIDKDNSLILDIKYKYIDNYENGYISYIENNLYGILKKDDNSFKINPKYNDVILINDKIFAGLENNTYQLYSYDNIDDSNSNKYDYVYAYDDVILVIKNKKIDILNNKLNSTLIMKIDSFYNYTTEKERDSLNIYSDGKNLYFRVYSNENEYVDYVYNIKSKKLI